MNNCQCGKPTKIKALCKKCYFKNYYIEATKHMEEKKVGRPTKDYEGIFQNVLAKVKEGLNISKACEAIGCNREALYKKMSKEQSQELKRTLENN